MPAQKHTLFNNDSVSCPLIYQNPVSHKKTTKPLKKEYWDATKEKTTNQTTTDTCNYIYELVKQQKPDKLMPTT